MPQSRLFDFSKVPKSAIFDKDMSTTDVNGSSCEASTIIVARRFRHLALIEKAFIFVNHNTTQDNPIQHNFLLAITTPERQQQAASARRC